MLVVNLNKEIFEIAFGEKLGINLYDFFEEVNQNHPDYLNILDGLFEDSIFFNYFLETISIATSLHKDESCISPYFHNVFKKFIREKHYLRVNELKSPFKYGVFVRLHKDKDVIDKIRKEKISKKISLDPYIKKNVGLFENLPQTFELYQKGNTKYLEVIQKGDELYSKYQSFGLSVLADEVKQDLEEFKSCFNQSIGFNKLKLSQAALILIKRSDLDTSKSNSCYLLPYHEVESKLPQYIKDLYLSLEDKHSTFDHYFALSLEENLKDAILMGERDGFCYYLDEIKCI